MIPVKRARSSSPMTQSVGSSARRVRIVSPDRSSIASSELSEHSATSETHHYVTLSAAPPHFSQVTESASTSMGGLRRIPLDYRSFIESDLECESQERSSPTPPGPVGDVYASGRDLSPTPPIQSPVPVGDVYDSPENLSPTPPIHSPASVGDVYDSDQDLSPMPRIRSPVPVGDVYDSPENLSPTPRIHSPAPVGDVYASGRDLSPTPPVHSPAPVGDVCDSHPSLSPIHAIQTPILVGEVSDLPLHCPPTSTGVGRMSPLTLLDGSLPPHTPSGTSQRAVFSSRGEHPADAMTEVRETRVTGDNDECARARLASIAGLSASIQQSGPRCWKLYNLMLVRRGPRFMSVWDRCVIDTT